MHVEYKTQVDNFTRFVVYLYFKIVKRLYLYFIELFTCLAASINIFELSAKASEIKKKFPNFFFLKVDCMYQMRD